MVSIQNQKLAKNVNVHTFYPKRNAILTYYKCSHHRCYAKLKPGEIKLYILSFFIANLTAPQ
jgi:hypothetical protein